jgi:flagellar biogenesis protein FliO
LAALVPVAVLLIVLLGAAAALLWWTRRGGGALPVQGRRRRLRVIERLALSRGAALVLVEYEGRALLIGQSADRVSLIERGAARAPEAD